MQSDKGQFMANSANGCHKDMHILCIFKCLSSLFGLSFAMTDFFIRFTLKIVFLLWGNYQNISFRILSWLGKTNTFSEQLDVVSNNQN